MTKFQLFAIASFMVISAMAHAGSIRATEMTSENWQQLLGSKSNDLSVEFRQGDELPVTIEAQGDFLETKEAGATSVVVKRNFWIKSQDEKILISLDGDNFQPIPDLVQGSLAAGGRSDSIGGPVNAINVLFQAYLK